MTSLAELIRGSPLFTVLSREKIIGFFLIGVFSTLIDVGLLYFFTTGLGMWYIASATASYSCGMAVNFFFNKYFNFHDSNRHYFWQFFSFALISLVSLALTLVILFLAVELFSLNYLVGKAIAVMVAFAWNYAGQSRITFRLGKRRLSGNFRDYLS
jgi:dolichol-phosphate mannosyltransferase